MNSTNKFIIVIGEELKSGFFLALQKECKIDHQKICDLWDQYYEINSNIKKNKKEKKNVNVDVNVNVDDDVESGVEGEEKPAKKTSGVENKKLTSPTTIPQGKTSAIPRHNQTPVQFSDIDKLKVAELKTLNKERGLPISGNKAILTDALKSYERSQGVVDEDANDEDDKKDDKTRKPSKKKSEKKNEQEETKDKITIVKKKKSDKSAPPPVIALIKPEELKSYVDQYGKTIVADDLVCEDETKIIIAFKKFEDDTLYKLDTEHMEKCKELNLEFRIDEDFEP